VTGEPCAEFGSRTGLQQSEDVECVFVYDPLEIPATGVIETVADLDGLGDQECGRSGYTDLMCSGVGRVQGFNDLQLVVGQGRGQARAGARPGPMRATVLECGPRSAARAVADARLDWCGATMRSRAIP
jgi:hypothetical protein